MERQEHKQIEQISSYTIEGRDGEVYPAKLFSFLDQKIKNLPNSEIAIITPEILEVAKRSFTHWTDDGARFLRVLNERATNVSVVYDPSGENIVAFNLYEQGNLEGVNGQIKFVYTHYVGVDPQPTENGKTYRGQGLMEKSRTSDTRSLNPDVVSGCTANGAILRGVRSTANELERLMFPEVGEQIPRVIFNIGKAIYSYVNGQSAGQTIDSSLIRHGDSPYLRGSAQDQLIDLLPTNNDAILYVSMSKPCAVKLGIK